MAIPLEKNGPIGLDTNRYDIYTWSSKTIEYGNLSAGGKPAATPLTGDLSVTKKEIVRTISEEIGLTQLQTKEIVQKTFDAIVEALVAERRIELRNFGVFEVKRRAPRKARNPRTGDKVFVPEKSVVTFKPGKEMEERVKELERQAAAAARVGRAKAAPASAEKREPSSKPAGTPRRAATYVPDTEKASLRCLVLFDVSSCNY